MWPVCEIIHFVGLCLLVGVVGFFDLRLLGFFRRVPLSAAWSLVPWGKFGFALAAMTGVTFFIGAPDQYVHNSAWYFKLLFLAVAMINLVVFETTQKKRMLSIGAGENTPTSFKVAGAVSMGSWFLVLYFGRMLPFIGNAF